MGWLDEFEAQNRKTKSEQEAAKKEEKESSSENFDNHSDEYGFNSSPNYTYSYHPNGNAFVESIQSLPFEIHGVGAGTDQAGNKVVMFIYRSVFCNPNNPDPRDMFQIITSVESAKVIAEAITSAIEKTERDSSNGSDD
jgi:hypothetical protein